MILCVRATGLLGGTVFKELLKCKKFGFELAFIKIRF
jgi:hypothetical protein